MTRMGIRLPFAQNTGPSNGSLSFASDGSFTYTPDADFFGTDSFTYTITDADGATDTATVTITINSVNDAPTVTPIADQTDQDSDVINFDVSGNFSDTENDTLTFSATGLPTGLSIDANTGVISGTIDGSASQSGPFTVMVTADDGNGGSVTDTFTWNVTNPGPSAGNDSFSTSEDTAVSGSVAANDNDPDGIRLHSLRIQDRVTVPCHSPAMDHLHTLRTQISSAPTLSPTRLPTPMARPIRQRSQSRSIQSTTHRRLLRSLTKPTKDSDVINFDVSGNFSDTENDTLTFSATDCQPD